jgi:hypothetical protein
MSMRGHNGKVTSEIKPYRVAFVFVAERANALNILKHTLIIG